MKMEAKLVFWVELLYFLMFLCAFYRISGSAG